MADPEAIFPYFDMYDGPFLDDLISEHANPALTDLSPPDTGQPSSHDSASLPPSDHNHDQYVINQDQVSDQNNNSLLDPNPDSWIRYESGFDGAGSSDQAGPSGLNNDQQQVGQENVELPAEDNFTGHENTGQLPTWPVPPVQFNCNFCQVLREIIHVNEEHNNHLKLEIHGRLGLIYHAIIERTNAYVNNTSGDRQLEMLDFCRKSCEDVKQFLTQYCLDRKQEGYVMMDDPLSLFYEALSIGLAWHDILINSNAHFVDQNLPPASSTINSENQVEQRSEQGQADVQQQQGQEANRPAERNGVERNRRRISLSEQRKRTANMTLMDLRGVFHLSMDEAAKCMQVCPTVVKKICRKYDLLRWPFRKVRSIKGKIEKLRPRLESSDAEARARAEAEIDRLKGEATIACGGISIL